MTFQRLPAEVRNLIYEKLFEGAELHPRWKSVNQAKEFESRIGILHVNKEICKEALDVLEKKLTIVVPPQALRGAEQVYPRAQLIEISPSAWTGRRRPYTSRILNEFKQAHTITYNIEGVNNPRWLVPALECWDWDDVFAIVSGKRDNAIADTVSKGWVENLAHVKHDHFACGYSRRIVFQFSALQLGFFASMIPKEIEMYCRVSVDVTNCKVVSREVNFQYTSSGEARWIPAEKVVVLKEGLRRPAFYHLNTGEMRVLLEADDFLDHLRNPELVKADVALATEREEVMLDYEKRGKCIGDHRPEILTIREVERQLSNKAVLNRALVSALRCSPVQ